MDTEKSAKNSDHFSNIPLPSDDRFHLNRFEHICEKMRVNLAFQSAILRDFLLGFCHGRAFDVNLQVFQHFTNALIQHAKLILPIRANIHIEIAHAHHFYLAAKQNNRLRHTSGQNEHE
ncbi:hypothetical protein D3C84_886150 [compost metagenome]